MKTQKSDWEKLYSKIWASKFNRLHKATQEQILASPDGQASAELGALVLREVNNQSAAQPQQN